MSRCVEFVRLKPKPGSEERLLEIRPRFVGDYKRDYPSLIEAQLHRLEDGNWLDVWVWRSRADAEDAIAKADNYPAFNEWLTLVETVAFDWAETIGD